MSTRVGVVSDGSAEIESLRILLRKLKSDYTIIESAAAYAQMQPKSTPKQIAKAAASKVDILHNLKKIDKVIVIIDREDLEICPGEFSEKIRKALHSQVKPEVSVVVKDKKFENWLLASPDTISKNSKRFQDIHKYKNKIAPNRADNIIDSENLLKKTAKDNQYNKGVCPNEILEAACPDEMGANSRSFRKFLQEAGVRKYKKQSLKP